MIQGYKYNHWLDSPDKTVLPFFFSFSPKNLRLAALHNPVKLFASLSPGWGWSGYAFNSRRERSSYIFSALEQGTLQVFLHLWETEDHVAGREVWRTRWVPAAAAAPPSHGESPHLVLVCAQRHCQKRPQNPVFGRCWHQNGRPSGDSGARTSPRWLHVRLSSKNGGDMARSSEGTNSHFLVCCWFFLVSGVGTWRKTARPLTASWFPDHIDRSQFCHLSALPRSILNGLSSTFATWIRNTQHYPFVADLSTGGGSTLHIVLGHEDDIAKWNGPCRFDAKTLLNLSSGHPRFGHDSFCGCWCAAPVLIIETPPASSKFTRPAKGLGSQRTILAESCFWYSWDFSLCKSFIYL